MVYVDYVWLRGYVSNRYEDAWAFHAVKCHLEQAGNIPPAAWGRAVWSEELSRNYRKAWRHRITDVLNSRNMLADLSERLLQALATYAGKDTQIAVDIHLQTAPIDALLGQYLAGVQPPAVRPGAQPPDFFFPEWSFADPPPRVAVPPERFPKEGSVMEEDGTHSTATGATDDELDGVVVPNVGRLHVIDTLVSDFRAVHGEDFSRVPEWARGDKLPWRDYIRPIWLTCPNVIRGRAGLMQPAVDAYDELRVFRLRHETGEVPSHWRGRAATSFANQVDQIDYFLGEAREEVAWLIRECEEAAAMLTVVRNETAEATKLCLQALDREVDTWQEAVFGWLWPFGDGMKLELADVLGGIFEQLFEYLRRGYQILDSGMNDLFELRHTHDDRRGADFVGSDHQPVRVPPGAVDPSNWEDLDDWRSD